MLSSTQNCKKYTFLDNLRTITQEENMETRQITPFFSSTFSALTVTFIFVFENSQNSFSCCPPFGRCWSVKYLNFGPKAIWTADHTFLESRHPEATKNPYYFLSTHRSQIPIFLGSSSWTTSYDFREDKVNLQNKTLNYHLDFRWRETVFR